MDLRFNCRTSIGNIIESRICLPPKLCGPVIQIGRQKSIQQFENDSREASDDAKSITSIRSEQTTLQGRDLGMFDVAALIINKQIRSDIFTTAGPGLSLTGNKMTSLVMWFVEAFGHS